MDPVIQLIRKSQIKKTPEEKKSDEIYLDLRLKEENNLIENGLKRDDEKFRDQMAKWTKEYYEKN